MKLGIVSSRVALLLRSTEIKPWFDGFVRLRTLFLTLLPLDAGRYRVCAMMSAGDPGSVPSVIAGAGRFFKGIPAAHPHPTSAGLP